MKPRKYRTEITLSRAIPDEILIEHIAVGLRTLGETKVLGVTVRGSQDANPVTTTYKNGRAFAEPAMPKGRSHPFDGPEVFDDDVDERLPLTADFWNALAADFPHLTQFFAAKGRTVASPPREEPPAEGDWTLDSGDHVGEDV